MKRTRHKPEQIMGKLRQAVADLAGGLTIGQVCRKLGVSEPTYHRRRQQYGGMKAGRSRRPGVEVAERG